MKHIKGMLVLSDYLFWLVVRQIKSQRNKQQVVRRDKASEASYRHQSNDFCGGKQAPTKMTN